MKGGRNDKGEERVMFWLSYKEKKINPKGKKINDKKSYFYHLIHMFTVPTTLRQRNFIHPVTAISYKIED